MCLLQLKATCWHWPATLHSLVICKSTLLSLLAKFLPINIQSLFTSIYTNYSLSLKTSGLLKLLAVGSLVCKSNHSPTETHVLDIQVLHITTALSQSDAELLQDYMSAWMASVFELSMYALYLRSCPAKMALLAVKTEGEAGNEEREVQKRVMQECKTEWETILQMEADATLNPLLKQLCPHTRYHCVREPLTFMEQNKWEMNETVESMILAWHPKVSHSANIEGVFNSLEDIVKRSMKSNNPSLPNIQRCAIRAVHRKLCQGDSSPNGVVLEPQDFEGSEIRNIRPGVFKPESFQSRSSAFRTKELFVVSMDISKDVRKDKER